MKKDVTMKASNCNHSTPIMISMGLFDEIRASGKNWRDVLALYQLYCHRALLQGTTSVYACDDWMSNQMGCSLNKFQTTKKTLNDMGLIRAFRKFDKSNRFGKTYHYVKFQQSSSSNITLQDSEIPMTTPENGVLLNKRTTPKKEGSGNGRHSLLRETNSLEDNTRERERRKGKGERPQLQNFENTIQGEINKSEPIESVLVSESPESVQAVESPESIQAVEAVQVSEAPKSIQVVESPKSIQAVEAPKSIRVSESPKTMNREEYTKIMSELFNECCGIEGEHILLADLQANSRRLNWADQQAYWEKRFSTIDNTQIEAWSLIAKYLGVYQRNNNSYPNNRSFLAGWRAIDWKDEKARIIAFCKTRGADIALKSYIEARGEEGRVVNAKWLLSSADYIRWFNNDDTDGSDNRPSAGPEGFDSLERRRIEGVSKAHEEQEKKRSLNLIERAKVIIRTNMNVPANKEIIVDLLKGYRDGDITLNDFDNGIQALERQSVHI